MATVVQTTAPISRTQMSTMVTWTPLTAANATGDTFEWPKYSDRCFQVIGTFGSATAILQGSNDGTNWVTLHDPLGNSISFTTTGLKQVLEVTRYMRPSTSGGDGTQSLTALLLVTGKSLN